MVFKEEECIAIAISRDLAVGEIVVLVICCLGKNEDMVLLEKAAHDSGKVIDIHTYDAAPHAFFDDTRKDSYRSDAAQSAWESTVAFLDTHVHAER